MTDRVFPASKPPTATNGVPPGGSIPPPPAPAAVTSNGTTNGIANQKPQVYIPPNRPIYRPQPYSRRHHHQSRPSCRRICCCCCFWSILIILILALMTAIAATAMYVIYHPRPPSFSVPSLRIGHVNLTTASDSSVSHLSSLFNFTLLSENPNQHLTFSYDPFTVTVISAKSGTVLGNGTVPAFFSDNGNKTSFHGVIATSTSARELDPDEAKHLKSDLTRARVGFEIQMRTKVKMIMGKLKSEGVEIKVSCEGFEGAIPKAWASALVTRRTRSGSAPKSEDSPHSKPSTKSPKILQPLSSVSKLRAAATNEIAASICVIHCFSSPLVISSLSSIMMESQKTKSNADNAS